MSQKYFNFRDIVDNQSLFSISVIISFGKSPFLIWTCGKEPGLTDVMGVVTEIYHKDWKPQTVSTFLAKLVRKNYVQLKRNGKIYTYKILIPEKAYRRKLYKHHISFWNPLLNNQNPHLERQKTFIVILNLSYPSF